MGQAFVLPEIKEGDFYPFVQTQCMCEVSIFHPFVYPQYRPPMSDSELAAIEAEERALEEEEYGVAPYDEDELTINDIRNKS